MQRSPVHQEEGGVPRCTQGEYRARVVHPGYPALPVLVPHLTVTLPSPHRHRTSLQEQEYLFGQSCRYSPRDLR